MRKNVPRFNILIQRVQFGNKRRFFSSQEATSFSTTSASLAQRRYYSTIQFQVTNNDFFPSQEATSFSTTTSTIFNFCSFTSAYCEVNGARMYPSFNTNPTIQFQVTNDDFFSLQEATSFSTTTSTILNGYTFTSAYSEVNGARMYKHFIDSATILPNDSVSGSNDDFHFLHKKQHLFHDNFDDLQFLQFH